MEAWRRLTAGLLDVQGVLVQFVLEDQLLQVVEGLLVTRLGEKTSNTSVIKLSFQPSSGIKLTPFSVKPPTSEPEVSVQINDQQKPAVELNKQCKPHPSPPFYPWKSASM